MRFKTAARTVAAEDASVAGRYSVQVQNVDRTGAVRQIGFWKPGDGLLWTNAKVRRHSFTCLPYSALRCLFVEKTDDAPQKVEFPGGRLSVTDRISTLRGARLELTTLPRRPYVWLTPEARLDSAGKLTPGQSDASRLLLLN